MPSPESPEFGSMSQTSIASGAPRLPGVVKNAMVASQHEIASRIGVEVLKKGGNAVDAAIAVGIALAVVYPEAGNLGGGGFMLIRFADGRTTSIDYREMAPKAATRDVFVDKDGNLIRGEGGSTVGYRASGVPGTLRHGVQEIRLWQGEMGRSGGAFEGGGTERLRADGPPG